MKYEIKGHLKSFISLFSFFLLITSSCHKEKKNDYYVDNKGIKIDSLKGVTMKTNDADLLISYMIALYDSTMYMKSLMKDTLVRVYQIKDDSLIFKYKFLHNGTGPHEIINDGFISLYDKQQSSLSLFENPGRLTKGYIIDLKSNHLIQDKSSWKELNFNKMENYRIGHSFVYISDSLLLVPGGKYNSREILSIININDLKTVTPLDFWPNDGFEDNLLVKQAVYMDNARIFKNDILKIYIYVCGSGKYMEIFSIKNNQISDRTPICKMYPEYQVEEDDMNYSSKNDDVNRGFKVFVTDKFIYVRPIEFTLDMLRAGGANYKGYALNYGEKIDVFDWNGELVKRYELDTPFHSFIVDEKNEVIYVETDDLENGDSLIRKYNLK